MNNTDYRIRKIDESTELIDGGLPPRQANLPARSWPSPQESLAPSPQKEDVSNKIFARFYPPLLLFSTLLTGLFLYLYVSKPVVVQEVVNETIIQPSELEKEQVAPVEELSPFPVEDLMPGDHLPSIVERLEPVRKDDGADQLIPTRLGVEQVFELQGLNDEMEEYVISLPVMYPENLLAWNEESLLLATELVGEIEQHLHQVKDLQSNGVKLLERWNRLATDASPESVLLEQSLGVVAE